MCYLNLEKKNFFSWDEMNSLLAAQHLATIENV